jgi:hypothetical protein
MPTYQKPKSANIRDIYVRSWAVKLKVLYVIAGLLLIKTLVDLLKR